MGVTVNGRIYDISIKKDTTTYGFMTVPTSAEFRRRANDFAPVIGVPGMQLEYAEDMWRPWTLSDFRGGIGQEEWKDPTMFYDMLPGIRIFKNRIQLDTQFITEDASQNATYGVDFKGDHYAIVANKIRKRGTPWTEVHASVGAKPFTDIKVYGDKIYACAPGDTVYYSGNGTAWNEATQMPAKANTRALLAFRGDLWTATNTALRYSPDPINGPWKPSGDPIKIGDERGQLKWLTVIGGFIAIGRSDGIYLYEGSGSRAEGPVIDFENMAWEGNCKLFTVADGFLYYNVGDRVKRTDLQGAEFDVTPLTSGSNAKDLRGFGIPVGGQGYQGHIYVAFTSAYGNMPIIMEMPTIDPGGWRLVYEGTSGQTMNGAWFSDGANRLLINDGATRTQRFEGKRDAPYADYVQSTDIITSWFDAGDVWSKKIFAAILAYTRGLSATEKITLYYEKDNSGSWVPITTLTSGRENEVPFDPTNIAISARKLRLKIKLERDAGDSSNTPVLELPLVTSYMVRPDPVYAQQVIIRLHDNIMTHDGKPVEQTAATLKAFLRACEAYEFPLEYTDRDGATWDVFISRTEELRNFFFEDRAGNRRQEDVMVVTMREV